MLRRNLLVDAEMLFNRGDPLKGVIDFLSEANDVLDLLSEIIEVATNRFELGSCGHPFVRSAATRKNMFFDGGLIRWQLIEPFGLGITVCKPRG